ncbi:MAG: glycosyltransferase family 4 protein [Epsilonproteobacteria bacterium]|nr:glycosyltransferase family 4 protein [Campylobacterota bacterium]
MKIAIVHDWLVTNAGAEKVLKSIVELFADADIFSLVDFLSDVQREDIIAGKPVTTSFIQNLPLAQKHFRNYLPLFPKATESLNLTTYDLVISSSWAVAKGVKKREGALHISYCHTPIRYAWDLYDEYTSNLSQPKKFLVEKSLQYIRKWDLDTVSRVDYFLANSKFVQERIARTYEREATVIYPPVDIEKFTLCEEKEDFYLSASRLVPYKKTKLIVEAFNAMPDKKLVVIGSGEEYESIKKIANANVEVLGYQEDAVLLEYMQKARAFVYAAVEDFGIVPVEAMACGTPVVALGVGGTKESVSEGISGVHFLKQTKESIIEAIAKFESMNFDAKTISKYAQKFSKKEFQQKFEDFVLSKTKSL